MQEKHGKIFGIGLSRTGTSSLNKALIQLGFDSVHFPIIMKNSSTKAMIKYRMMKWLKELGMKQPLFQDFTQGTNNKLKFDPATLYRHDAFTDLPVARFYKQIDSLFPGSRFILTKRDKMSWLNSCEAFFAKHRHQKFKWIQLHHDMYATNHFDESKFSNAMDRHLEDVRMYFKGREHDLLELDIPAGESFDKLCPFLSLPVREGKFPKENTSTK